MGNQTKEDDLYREMCRVVGKVVLEMRDLGQEPKHIVIAGVLRTALANQRIKRTELEKQAMETVIKALADNRAGDDNLAISSFSILRCI
ncbi:fumarate hydratase FumD [Escherichia fergusonii]|nr:fumarate hydratase FumD [Escherichia fergusonii]